MLVGAAIAATDSAAIFAVLRRSTLEKRLARSLEGESGMNDPVALLLVIGFIEWIQDPGFGAAEMAELLVLKLALGAAIGLALGWVAVRVLDRIALPSDGLYPVATIAIAGARLRPAEMVHGSGFLAVYLTALALGSARIPARRTVVGFHRASAGSPRSPSSSSSGCSSSPASLDNVALDALALSAVLIFVARPVAAFAATAFAPLNVRERLMLGWAGLRGATPIWLATFPVVAGIGAGEELFAIVFFVVVTSTLVQGASFEPLARRLGLTTDEPALPRRLFESGRIRRMGGDVISYRLPPGAAAAGHVVRELDLPREALVNVIVRDGHAIPPRGSTELRGGRRAAHPRPQRAARRGRGADPHAGSRGRSANPLRRRCRAAGPPRSSRCGRLPTMCSARRSTGSRSPAVLRDRGERGAYHGGPCRRPLRRSRHRAGRDRRPPGAGGLVRGRAERPERRRAERAWWQEVTGALIARGGRSLGWGSLGGPAGGSGELRTWV